MIGQNISHYRITSKLGEGGMGEVYRATDTKLNRDVALKVLPDAFAADRERMARFSREAQVLASLNHPNIGSIYDLEDSDDKQALVLELVEGETLAERIKGEEVPLEESLKIALQMAEALEAAHEKGIIHRDLKPANVKITPEGKVKVLDFGLAKALEKEVPDADLTHSPTRTGTAVGVIMGTAGYMSPEQARGQTVDKRTDIWAFGCVAYEMLTGKQVFGGETVTDILAAIVDKDPDWAALPEGTPGSIQRLLRRCLDKDPHERLRDIGDARIEIKQALERPELGSQSAPSVAPHAGWQRLLPWALASMAIVALVWALIDSDEAPEGMGTVRFPIFPPDTVSRKGGASISPNGKQIVFNGLDDTGRLSLWVHKMNSPIAQSLNGTDQQSPGRKFWSPDSRFIGFFANGELKKIDLSGGPAVSLADARSGGGGTWNREGTIVFAPSRRGSLYRVSASGGEATPITTLDESRQETSHQRPYFLPDGRHFLYSAETEETEAIYLGSLHSEERKFLVNSSRAVYAPPGYLLFLREGTLMAQPFDTSKLETSGEPVPFLQQISSFSFSENGILTYMGDDLGTSSLAWRDRSGKALESLGEPGGYVQVVLSPDQKRVAVARSETGRSGIWLLELSSGVFSRFTFHWGGDPTWSPDGHRVAFVSVRKSGLFQKSVGGSEVESLFKFKSENPYWLDAWSEDGHLVLHSRNPKLGNSVYAFSPGEDEKPRLLIEDPFYKDELHLSPDGKWIAYNSDESGRHEVYIATFPDFSSKRQVSKAGGFQALWRGDGKELFFLQPDGKLLSVDVKAGSTLATGIPKVLFQTGVNPDFSRIRKSSQLNVV